MNLTAKIALKWGAIIGLANLVWLYLSYYIGLHTGGIILFQLVPIGWLLITLAGYIVALRDLKWHSPDLGYWVGVRTGALIGVVTAFVAVLMQIGYYTVIHPAWPEYMLQQTREYFSGQGLPQAQLEQRVAEAQQAFSLGNYATQSAVSALLAGIALSVIIMIFLRKKAANAEI